MRHPQEGPAAPSRYDSRQTAREAFDPHRRFPTSLTTGFVGLLQSPLPGSRRHDVRPEVIVDDHAGVRARSFGSKSLTQKFSGVSKSGVIYGLGKVGSP